MIATEVHGRLLGDRYHIVRELGRGGMGVVYLGRDLRRDMDVAIKFRGVVHHAATLWLKREFRAAASLRHPNLVELYELVAHDTSCYFTMEYVRGVDPRRWVERREAESPPPVISDRTTRSVTPIQDAMTEATTGPSPTAIPTVRAVPVVDFGRVRAVLAQLAEGCAFLHAHGVIHRDVKPSNAIVDPDNGNLKLLDFGLALERRRAEEEVSRETRVVGTAAYLAPEYLERLAVSPAMDVYALGVVAFELVTGSPPFGGTLHVLSRLGRQVSLPRASQINRDVPPDLDDLIEAMLQQDPHRRPTSLQIATRLTGELSHPRPVRRAARFVGREAEVERLVATIGSAVPEGRFVLVTGPSGVGKTALLEEAVGRARLSETAHVDITWRGRCHERERVPYRAFDFVIDDLATELSGNPKLATALEHAGALGRVFPTLGAFLDAAAKLPAAEDLRVERERALLAMAELFRHVLALPRGTRSLGPPVGQSPPGSISGPPVGQSPPGSISGPPVGQSPPGSISGSGARAALVIDDLQWADEDSLELLAFLIEKIGRALTIVATWMTDGALPDRARALLERLGARADVIELVPMHRTELAELIADLAPSAPTERLRTAAALAAGSPYLAELIGRELADAGLAEPHSIEPGDPASPPERWAESRRLERLRPAERSVAEIASLAGGTATFDQLRAIAELVPAQLQSALRGLEDGRVLRSTPSASGEPVYVFYHQRLREAAIAAVAPASRAALHRRFAEVLEQGDATPDQLAYHWLEAGEPVRAARWTIAAADAARDQLAWGLAADGYGRALELALDSRAIPVLELRAQRAQALFLGGKLAAAADEFEALARAAGGDAGDRWHVRAAESYIKLGELDRGLALLDRVLVGHGQHRALTGRVSSTARAIGVTARWLVPRRLRPTGKVDEVIAAADRVIASFLSTPYPLESFEYVVRGITSAERAGDHAAYSLGMAMLAAYLAAGSLGRFGDRAIATAQRLAIESGAPYSRMVAAGAAGILATLRGNWSGMRLAHEEGHQLCKRLGLERSWEASFLRTYWALGEYYAGEPRTALAMLGELAEASDDLISRAMLGSFRGRALVLEGDLVAARALEHDIARSPATRRGLGSIYHQVFAGELALAQHDWARAAAIGHELARTARTQWLSAMPAVSAMIDVVCATAELGLARAGDRRRATVARERARALHRRGRSSFYAATALRLWGQAEAVLGDVGTARHLYARARTVAAERGGRVDQLALAALAGAAHDAGPLAFAVAWCTGGEVT